MRLETTGITVEWRQGPKQIDTVIKLNGTLIGVYHYQYDPKKNRVCYVNVGGPVPGSPIIDKFLDDHARTEYAFQKVESELVKRFFDERAKAMEPMRLIETELLKHLPTLDI